MNTDLAAFLAQHPRIDEDVASWNNGMTPLRIVSYLSDSGPPSEYITSVRGIVFHGASVLVLRNIHSTHIMPGGRREAGEAFEQTFRREVLEETGWTITRPVILGFRHLYHLAPKPADYPYPHPDFAWLIYIADAVDHRPEAQAMDDYEVDATFRPLDEVRTLNLTRAELLYLETARQRRRDGR